MPFRRHARVRPDAATCKMVLSGRDLRAAKRATDKLQLEQQQQLQAEVGTCVLACGRAAATNLPE